MSAEEILSKPTSEELTAAMIQLAEGGVLLKDLPYATSSLLEPEKVTEKPAAPSTDRNQIGALLRKNRH